MKRTGVFGMECERVRWGLLPMGGRWENAVANGWQPTIWGMFLAGLAMAGLAVAQGPENPQVAIDLASAGTPTGGIERVFGWAGDGSFGVPVCGGFDCDGDGFPDVAFSSLMASPAFRTEAGEVALVFGDGVIGGEVDTGPVSSNVLKVIGSQPYEVVGAEVWMDDLTGDGLGDVIFGRQNYTPETGREGAGALSILAGGAHLRQRAADGLFLDLGQEAAATQLRIEGASAYDRLGIWMRTADVDGDGTSDCLVGMDQTDAGSDLGENQGSILVIRGGSHVASGGVWDLADGDQPNLIRVDGPADGLNFHFGATVQVADLDGNGRAECLVAATIARAGAVLRLPGTPAGASQATAGAPGGRLYILWDDNFPAASFVSGARFSVTNAPGTVTILEGESANQHFGEEILAGLDFDGDAEADLFVGDLLADPASGNNAGLGHIIFGAGRLKGAGVGTPGVLQVLGALPAGVEVTRIEGPIPGSISSDTASQGDFDGDGLGDLVVGNPHDNPFGRTFAGSMHLLYGRVGRWPATVSLVPGQLPAAEDLRVSVVWGGKGTVGTDAGDTLCYSASFGDMDLDGRDDLLVNEMVGNAPSLIDVGNLLVISGRALEWRPPVFTESAMDRANGVFRLATDTTFGRTYQLEASPDLAPPTWLPLQSGILGAGPGGVLAVPDSGVDRRFFRLMEE